MKHVDHPFWKEHRTRTREQLGKGFFLLGEVWGGEAQVLDPWFSGDEIDAGFDFSFQGNVLSFVLGRGRAVAFDHYLKSREKIRQGYLVSHFLSSHDVPGALFQLNGNKQLFRLSAVLQFTSVGIPMIYYGEEVGRPGGDWPDNRSDMPWGNRDIKPGAGEARDEELRDAYRRLIEIRKTHPSLSQGIHSTISTEGDLLVFQQQDPSTKDTVIVAVNRGSSPANLNITLPSEWGQSPIWDAWNNLDLVRKGDSIDLSVGAREARILTKR